MTTTLTDDTTAGPPRREGRPGHGGRSVRPALLRLHFYAGILVGPFVLVAALTGLLYAATPQVEQAVYAEELTTDARGPALPLDDQVAAARAAQPDLPLLAVRPAPETGQTTRVLFDTGRSAESRRLAVFVDPVTGEVRGQLTSYGTSGSLPLRTWIDELHRSLHLGSVGRLYSELAASWLGVVVLAGLALWWTGPRRGAGRPGDPDGRPRRLRPLRSGSPRRRTLSWHGAVGTWLLLGMLMLSATGLTWSQHAGAHVTQLRAALDWSTPAVVADLDATAGGQPDHADHADHAGHAAGDGDAAGEDLAADSPGLGWQVAADAARSQGVEGLVEITRPASSGSAWVVQEIDRSWPTRVDAASVDPATGEVVDVVRFADYPLAAKLARWGIDLHMGVLFGVVNQVLLGVLALGLAAMVVWGYRMWWLRRPTRATGPGFGRPPRRGAWRSLPRPVLAGAVVGGAALAWCLPVLGVSLVAFVVVDLLVGALRAGSAPPRGAAGP